MSLSRKRAAFATAAITAMLALSSVSPAAAAVAPAQPPLSVSSTASTRCVLGKAVVSTTVTNPNAFPVKAVITSLYGTKTVTALPAGGSALHAFTTRAVSIPAGATSTTASAFVAGKAASATVTAAYPETSCG